METENKIDSPEDVILPDFTELEKSIDQLVEVVEKDFSVREQERIDLAAQEKKEKEQLLLEEKAELTEVKKSEESLLEAQTFETEYKESLLLAEETQVDSMEILIGEIQTLNSNTVMQIERMDNQNELIIEASLTLIIVIVVAMSVKIFIDQVTKW